jgi:hypothetical protein
MIKTDAPQLYLPVCGVFAVFLADPVRDFDQTFKVAKKNLGRRDNWKGRMHWYELLKLLRFAGVQYREFETRRPAEAPIGLTINRAFKDGHFASGKQYIIRVAGHFLTVKDGLCYDQGHPNGKPVADYRRKRSVITHCAVLK